MRRSSKRSLRRFTVSPRPPALTSKRPRHSITGAFFCSNGSLNASWGSTSPHSMREPLTRLGAHRAVSTTVRDLSLSRTREKCSQAAFFLARRRAKPVRIVLVIFRLPRRTLRPSVIYHTSRFGVNKSGVVNSHYLLRKFIWQTFCAVRAQVSKVESAYSRQAAQIAPKTPRAAPEPAASPLLAARVVMAATFLEGTLRLISAFSSSAFFDVPVGRPFRIVGGPEHAWEDFRSHRPPRDCSGPPRNSGTVPALSAEISARSGLPLLAARDPQVIKCLGIGRITRGILKVLGRGLKVVLVKFRNAKQVGACVDRFDPAQRLVETIIASAGLAVLNSAGCNPLERFDRSLRLPQAFPLLDLEFRSVLQKPPQTGACQDEGPPVGPGWKPGLDGRARPLFPVKVGCGSAPG